MIVNITMKKNVVNIILLSVFILFASCGTDDSADYIDVPDNTDTIPPIPEDPVVIDFEAVPYSKLSDYKFFEGDIKNMEPVESVLPYDLNSSLFTDYAHKKRFVWMPESNKATYTADGDLLNFPTGTVLIKSFYYENVLPDNSVRIVETRLMIKKANEWIFANYVWNSEQNEAVLDMNGSFTDISWQENNVTKNTSYRIPSGSECFTCHKSGSTPIPIGTKPQNLNKLYNYTDGSQNQLGKWIEKGYLENNIPDAITSTVNWEDVSQSLDLRVRSYVDINCAHCHSEGAHCDYMPMRFAFSETTIPENLGICVEPFEFINSSLTYIVAKKNPNRSALHYRMNTNNESERMPLLGRTVIHEEGVALMEEWINAMDNPCP